MSTTDAGNSSEGFSDLLKASWIKSSAILAIILTATGLVVLYLLKIFNIGSTPLFSELETFFANYGLVGIFLATILAGTFIPLGSPALIVAAALFGVNPISLVLIGTTGFTIGMIINYALAYRLGRPYVTRKVSAEKLEEIIRLWDRWGWIIYTIFGLIPVLPVELLSFICGLLKTRLVVFLILSFVPRLVVFTILAHFGECAGVWIGIV